MRNLFFLLAGFDASFCFHKVPCTTDAGVVNINDQIILGEEGVSHGDKVARNQNLLSRHDYV